MYVPDPVISLSIKPKGGETPNFSRALNKFTREDPTFRVHIDSESKEVRLYLFFLPFQLVSQFRYYAIPGVAMAAFIYLGFVAAGEEMEQPFGA